MTSADLTWRPPSTYVALAAGEVHAWRASLDAAPATIQRLQQLLNAEERARAGTFRFARDRNQYIIARGVLRTLLGLYLQRFPAELSFGYNAYGKPFLPANEGTIEFNISHSHHLALFAFTSVAPVGIDVEYMRADVEYEQLARHFFSAQENAALQSLPQALRQQAFYSCWTRKEAYIKARGQGLSLPLDQFDVSLTPGEPAALLSSRGDDVTSWTLQELVPGVGYAGALAINSPNCQLRCWQWSPSD